MKRAVPTLLIVFLATACAATGYAYLTNQSTHLNASNYHTSGYSSILFMRQGVAGRIEIANVTPLCTASGQTPASGPNLIIMSTTGNILVVPLTWNRVDQCELVSLFHVELQPGSYSLTVSPCNYIGCRSLPITVTVGPGIIVPVKISITTGIY